MSFSNTTVTHTFLNADGTPSSGAATFTLSDLMTNGTSSITPGEITANLNGSGVLTQALTSNLDLATWQVGVTGSPSSGAFQIQCFSTTIATTVSVPYNATAAQIQAALQLVVNPTTQQSTGIPGLAAVTCSGGPLPAAVSVLNVPGNFTFTVVNSTVVGGSITLTNTVPGTTPAAPLNASWRVDLRILGASQRSFFVVVPANGGTVDLFTLIPFQQQV